MVRKLVKHTASQALTFALALAAFTAPMGCESPPRGGGDGRAVGPLPGGLTVWAVSDCREIAVDTAPMPENELYSESKRVIAIDAASNETVAFQLVMRGAATSPALQVRIGELKGGTGSIPASAVQLFRGHYSQVDSFQSWYPSHTGRPATPTMVLDTLVPWSASRGGGPVNFASGRNEVAWVDVQVPPGTSAGMYIANVELLPASGNGRALFLAELRLNVLPVSIPVVPALSVVGRVDPRELLRAHLGWSGDIVEELRLLRGDPSQQAGVKLVDAAMATLQDHGLAPVLWAGFPKYKLAGERAIEMDWADYDALIAPWMDGGGFRNRAPATVWTLPVSTEYPGIERNGGVNSPKYARLLATYAKACEDHFSERGWASRAVVRVSPPAALDQPGVTQVERIVGILQDQQWKTPIVAHLPIETLRGLGWVDCPQIDIPGIGVFAPPAAWFEPEAAAKARTLGKQTWYQPEHAPYSGALTIGAPAEDVLSIPWQAYRYGATGIWLEHAADSGSARPRSGGSEALIHAGKDFGLPDEPVPSVRLKRLRRGIQDFSLLKQLSGGGPLLAQRTSQQLVKWGFTDAATSNLLTGRGAGWARDPLAYWLARRVLLQELAPGAVAPEAPQAAAAAATLDQWDQFMKHGARLEAEPGGARILADSSNLRAFLTVAIANGTTSPVTGRWLTPELPPGWERVDAGTATISPDNRAVSTIELKLGQISYDATGATNIPLVFESDAGQVTAAGRIAITACPLVDKSPVVDGRVDEWLLAANNIAGDFRLVRRGKETGEGTDKPTLPTRAYFCMDGRNVYFAIVCSTPAGELPVWRADNAVDVDGAVPWGQDLIEVLLSPLNARDGTGGDILVLQVKPSGLLIARKGALTSPPMNASELWQPGGQVAVGFQQDAWTVEMSIPLSALDPEALRSRIWGVNVTRLDSRRGEYSSWSGARGNCYSPARLGNLVLQRP